jgi:hypothetical protein
LKSPHSAPVDPLTSLPLSSISSALGTPISRGNTSLMPMPECRPMRAKFAP